MEVLHFHQLISARSTLFPDAPPYEPEGQVPNMVWRLWVWVLLNAFHISQNLLEMDKANKCLGVKGYAGGLALLFNRFAVQVEKIQSSSVQQKVSG